ncbi:MAG: hypothetical protein E7668_03620 [Ruminococcaceae bacterium]|nr:hypothetical protein [Oscillospiraceae bacterium]
MKRKLICLALSVVMLLGILPLAIFATEETTAPITQYGTETADWYTIGTVAELNHFIQMEKGSANLNCNIRLTADIDYTAEGATAPTSAPQAECSMWQGTFDGNNKTIKGAKTAILCCIQGTSTVKNLTLLDSTIAAGQYDGVLATDIWGPSTITIQNVHVKNATLTNAQIAARLGLIGTSWGKGNITLNVSDCTVEGTATFGANLTGVCAAATYLGFIRSYGAYTYAFNFSNCIAAMDFTLANNNGTGVSGFLGQKWGSEDLSGLTATFTNCVNYGDITNTSTGPVAGFSAVKDGNVVMTDCVNFGDITGADANGLVNDTTGTVTLTDCYDTAEAVAVPTGKGDYASVDISAASAQGYAAATTFADWSFGTDWMLTNSYPVPASLLDLAPKGQSENAIVYEGVQYTAEAEGIFNVRFVTTISEETFDTSAEIGYEVIVVEEGKAGKSLNRSTDTVYESLTGWVEGERVVYHAEDFDGDYLSAVAINGVTATKTVTIIVRPYVLDALGNTQNGLPVACVFTDGALVAQYAY